MFEGLEVVDDIGSYNWGGATMPVLYRYMCAVSCQKTKTIGGYSFVWEVIKTLYTFFFGILY